MASPVFLYLSDDPQAYLLFLKDYIRSCADICHNCKVRCLENFIKTASAPDLGWNRLSPDERPRPAHTLLDAQLADLGINSSNHYGLELSDEEIDDVFQPAVRRLTLNANWVLVVEAFAAMTAYRGMGRPDRADDRYDQYKLGKKILWMACPQFTTQELVKHKPSVDLMSHWLWNLGQLLSDGADVYLSSSESQPANTALCTCPIFSILNGQYPDVYTGYEWVNVVLRAAQQRVEPALLEAWAQPLNEEELLTSSAPYRPLCPGYDCQADTSWQEDQVHKRNNVVDVPRLADVVWDWSVDQIRLLGSGTSPSDPSNPESDPVSAAVDPSHTPDSLRPGFLLLTGTPSTSASINSEFRDYHLDTFPPCRFAHFLRQDLLRAFLAHTFRLNAATCNTLPDLFVKAAFASSYIPPSPSSSSSSSSHTPYLPPIKSLFDAAHRDYFHHKTLLQEIPLDKNQNRKVKPFRHPRLCRNQGAHDANGFHFRPSSWAQGWLIGYGTIDWKTGADYEDRNMRWGPQHLMRQMFDWEGGVLGWELDD